ncbi:MAG: IPT/TIG domain-containing protein [Parachlamydiaceae bacterium]|nr:IPT/TIG domain-containing protein [Parachlamydiaceae bacterium]
MNLIKLFIVCFSIVVCTNSLIAAPVITSVSPSKGSVTGGNIVTINGSGFTGASAINFGFRPATFTVITDNSISAIAPQGTSGTVDISVIVSGKTSAKTRADFYTYTESSWQGIISGINQDAIILFNTGTNTISSIIPLPADSLAAIITPDGTKIYAADSDQANVNVIDVATKAIIANIPLPVAGTGAFDIIVSPNGKRVYISNFDSGYVTVIDTITNTVVADIFVAPGLGPLSITPDGKTVYVSNFSLENVTTINTATNTVGVSIITGIDPAMIAITPNGKTAYVANFGSDTISIIDVATNIVTNTIIFPPGSGPYGSFILPIGNTMYVANINNSTVSVVNLTTNTITKTIVFPPGSEPFWVVSTPDSKKIYVINEGTDDVTPINVASNTTGPSFGNIGDQIQDIVMSPDQAPVASFFVNIQPAGFPTVFNASDSISPIGTIASYAWDFGDGTTLTTNNPIVEHIYTSIGSFKVVLTVTNSAGTSTTKVFSSRFMSNNGGPTAVFSKIIKVKLLIPTVTNVNPNFGFITGGNTVNITGTNFINVTSVNFGLKSALFTVNSATSITAIAPPGSVGTVDVRVTTLTGISQINVNDQYVYKTPPPFPPTVTNLNPNFGFITGGNTVNITGTNFINVTSVNFGLKSALFTVNSSTSITAIAPPGSVGTVDVRVTTLTGISQINVNDQYVYKNPPPLPPSNFIGVIKKNKFLNNTECVLKSKWEASASTNVVLYRIYEKGKVVKEVSAISPLVFKTCLPNCSGKGFEIAAVSADNLESIHLKIKIIHE